MKQTVKTAFLSFITVLILLFILFVDTTFYQVPSFIKMFRVERELVISIAALLILYHVNLFFRRRKLSLKKTLVALAISVMSLFVSILLLQVVLKKYLVLWDNNPFLAEFPMIWNIASLVCSILTLAIFFSVLLLVKKLIDYRPNRYSDFEFRFLCGMSIVSAVVFNVIENRYSFEPLTLFQREHLGILLLIAVLIVLITLVISFYKSWTNMLNKREKYIGFGISFFMIPIGLYLFFSNLLFPVFAFSTTVKGFTLAMLVFINVYLIASFIGLLFRLPTASIYERMTSEISSISLISKMISDGVGQEEVFQTIVENACALTNSDACWLALEDEDSNFSRIMATVHLSESERNKLRRAEGCSVGDIIRNNREPVIVCNIGEDERMIPFQNLEFKWKSMIAAPLVQTDRVVGIIFSVKYSIYGFDETDLATLKAFAIQTNIALGPSSLNLDLEKLKIKNENEPGKLTIDNLSVFYPKDENINAGLFSTYKDTQVFYLIVHSDNHLVDGNEIKGVLKTVFSLEMSLEDAFNRAFNMIIDQYSGEKLIVGEFSDPPDVLTVIGNDEYCLLKVTNIAADMKVESLCKRQKDCYTGLVNIETGAGYLLGTASIVDRIKEKLLAGNTASDNEASNSDILKKIIPEFIKESGIQLLLYIEN